jgi:uncharacterized membrane protein
MAVGVIVLPCLLLGILCGLRAMTPPAIVCWAAHLGWLNLAGSHLAFLANPITVGIFTLLAVVELIGDKTSKIGPRTAPVGIGARLISGALCGAALATPAAIAIGAILSAVGAMIGTFAGYHTRRALTAPGKLPDLPVALAEDLIAIGGSLFLVSRF